MKNGNVIGIRRPGGMGIQAVRTDLKIENIEFLEKSSKVIPTSKRIWGIGIDWGVNGLKENGEIWSKGVRVILFCDVETNKREAFQRAVKDKLGEGEIKVVGKRPMFAKIEVDDKAIVGQDRMKIAEMIVEKVYKIYNEVKQCFDVY